MTTVRLPTDRLVSLADLIAATSAAVQPDDREHKIVDGLNPRATGKFSPRRQVADVHAVELVELHRNGVVTARSLFSRAPLAIPSYEDWQDTAKRYGLTFEDASAYCARLAIKVEPIGGAVAAPPPKETQEQRQARRYQACVDAGLKMPANDSAHLPPGIKKIAEAEGIARTSFTQDVKAHIRRINGR